MPVGLVLLAAGSGRRVRAGVNKVLLTVHGEPLVVHATRTALAVDDVARIVVVHRAGEGAEVAAAIQPLLGEREALLVEGGQERADSERAALAVLRADIDSGLIDVVAIHDVARPLASAALYAAVIAAARAGDGAVPARPISGLLGPNGPVQAVAVQTPQAFRAGPLVAAYDGSASEGTDTASYLEKDWRIGTVPGEATNLKVTYAGDVALVEALS